MHIADDHRHYGSALIQIAEDPHFTAINAFEYQKKNSRCGFRINQDIGVYLRYRSEPKGSRAPVYSFLFNQENLAELGEMNRQLPVLFLALVCAEDREICCLPYGSLQDLINTRTEARGDKEREYVIEVSVLEGKSLRVGINPPGEKGKWLKKFIVPRNDFPRALFIGTAPKKRPSIFPWRRDLR